MSTRFIDCANCGNQSDTIMMKWIKLKPVVEKDGSVTKRYMRVCISCYCVLKGRGELVTTK